MQDNEIKKGLSPLEKKTEENPSSEKEDAELLAPITKRNIPKAFNIGRKFYQKYPLIENEIFQKVNKKEVSFSEGTLIALCFAVGEKLYEDSFATGRAKGKEPLIGRALTPDGDIPLDITIKYIIENGWGIDADGNTHRKEVEDLIYFLHNTPLFSLNTEGSGEGENLFLVRKWRLDKYKVRGYRLYLNKVFCDLADGYGKYLRGVMKELVKIAGKKITSMDRPLLLYLGQQNKNKPHRIALESLIQKLGKWDEYKEHKGRIIESLKSVLERFKQIKKIGLDDYELTDNFDLIFYFSHRNKKELPKDKKE